MKDKFELTRGELINGERLLSYKFTRKRMVYIVADEYNNWLRYGSDNQNWTEDFNPRGGLASIFKLLYPI